MEHHRLGRICSLSVIGSAPDWTESERFNEVLKASTFTREPYQKLQLFRGIRHNLHELPYASPYESMRLTITLCQTVTLSYTSCSDLLLYLRHSIPHSNRQYCFQSELLFFLFMKIAYDADVFPSGVTYQSARVPLTCSERKSFLVAVPLTQSREHSCQL